MVARRKRFSIARSAEYTRSDRIAPLFLVMVRLLPRPGSTHVPSVGSSVGGSSDPAASKWVGWESDRGLAEKCRSIHNPDQIWYEHTLIPPFRAESFRGLTQRWYTFV